jgi:hypothetical protein
MTDFYELLYEAFVMEGHLCALFYLIPKISNKNSSEKQKYKTRAALEARTLRIWNYV